MSITDRVQKIAFEAYNLLNGDISDDDRAEFWDIMWTGKTSEQNLKDQKSKGN